MQQGQADSLAFLGVKLGGKHIVAPHGGREFTVIVGPCRHAGRVLGAREVAVDEIGVAAVGDAAVEGAIGPGDPELVPTDLGDLESGFGGEADDGSGEDAEAGGAGLELLAAVEECLVTDADAEEGAAAADEFAGGLEQFLPAQGVDAVIEGPDAGEHEAAGVGEFRAALDDTDGGADAAQGVVHAAEVAGAVIDQGDHRASVRCGGAKANPEARDIPASLEGAWFAPDLRTGGRGWAALVEECFLGVRLSEAGAEADAEVPEDGQEQVRMVHAQLVEVPAGEDPARAVGVGDDPGGAWGVVEEGHFAEVRARGESGDAVFGWCRGIEEDADSAFGEEEQFLGRAARGDEGVAGLEGAEGEKRVDEVELGWGEVLEEVEVGEVSWRWGRDGGGGKVSGWGGEGENAVLTGFEGAVVVGEVLEEVVGGLAEFAAHGAGEDGEVLSVGEGDGDAEGPGLEEPLVEEVAGAFVEAEDAAEVEDGVAEDGEAGGEVMQDDLGGGEGEVALELVELDRIAEGPEGIAFGVGPDAVGAEVGAGEASVDGDAGGGRAAGGRLSRWRSK